MNTRLNTDLDSSQLGELAELVCRKIANGEEVNLDRLTDDPDYRERLAKILPMLRGLNDLEAATSKDASGDEDGIQPLDGRTLGDFRIVRQLGRGGMGVVYEAQQLSLNRRVALKVLPFAALVQDKALQRFQNEVRAAAALDHPRIVSVYSIGEERGVHYYAMQLIHGQTIAEAIHQIQLMRSDGASLDGDSIQKALSSIRPIELAASGNAPTEQFASGDTEVEAQLPAGSTVQSEVSGLSHAKDRDYFRAVARLGIQAAEALQHAHDLGVLHRDIKPGNLMLDMQGKLYVTDFGLARIEADAGMTMTGDLVGTLRYMSPEQALAKRVVLDGRSDIYSLGVTLYELLTLQPAFAGEDRQELLRKIAFEDPSKPRQLNSTIPRELETILLKAIEKSPEARYTNCQDLADDLAAFLEYQPIKAKPPTLVQSVTKWCVRHSGVAATLAILLPVLTIISTIGLFAIWRLQHNTATALAAEETAKELANENLSLAKANAEKAIKNEEIAEQNLRHAQSVVDEFLTRVSQESLLNTPTMQPLRKDLLEKASDYYKTFVEKNSADSLLKEDLAKAHFRLGKVSRELGSEGYREGTHFAIAEEIWMELLKDDPDNADYLKGLADSLAKRADWQGVKPAPEAADMKMLETSLRIRRELSEQHPDNDTFNFDLASSLRDLASATSRLSQRDPKNYSHQTALGFALEALRLSQDLVDRNAENTQNAEGLAAALHMTGLMRVRNREPTRGLSDFKNAIRIREANIASEPQNLKFQERLAISCLIAAGIAGPDGDWTLSLELAKRSTQLYTRLAETNPGVLSYVNSVTRAYGALCNAENNVDGQDSESGTPNIDALRDCVAFIDRLVDRAFVVGVSSPEEEAYISHLRDQYLNFARNVEFFALRHDSQFTDFAEQLTTSALDVARQLQQLVPEDTQYRSFVVADLARLAELKLFLQEIDICQELLTELFTLGYESLKLNRTGEEENIRALLNSLAFAHVLQGNLNREQGELHLAAASFQDACRLLGENLELEIMRYLTPQYVVLVSDLRACLQNVVHAFSSLLSMSAIIVIWIIASLDFGFLS